MKIYTKTGDKGTTSLVGGSRVGKDSARLEAYGTVDELNSFIGVLYDTHGISEDIKKELSLIQDILFNAGSQLASLPEDIEKYHIPVVTDENVALLENRIDAMQAVLPQLHLFVLPGGHPANSAAHVCRSVCRRAERRTVALQNTGATGLETVIRFLNRLSDYLFTLARFASVSNGAGERTWRG